MDQALIYHFWTHSNGPVSQDMRVPIILSIATFRHWNKTTPIYVIDVSSTESNWEDYPEFLDFTVVKQDNCLKPLEPHIDTNRIIARMLSKPNDVYTFSKTIKQNIILVVDVDYFFLKKPNFSHDKNDPISIGDNTGYWRYHKQSYLTERGFQLWIDNCYEVCLNEELREEMKRVRNHSGVIQDEVVMHNLYKMYPDYYKYPPWKYNVLFNQMNPKLDGAAIHGLHILSCSLLIAKGQRGHICLYVKELKEIVTKILGKERLNHIFQGIELPEYSIKNMGDMVYLNTGKKSFGKASKFI